MKDDNSLLEGVVFLLVNNNKGRLEMKTEISRYSDKVWKGFINVEI